MFPWLAFGHMIPYLELVKLIASKGHRISFISTPRNIDCLPKISPNLALMINFVKLPVTHVDNLPKNTEATKDIPLNVVQFLKKAYDALKESMPRFLEDSRPDWLLHNFAPYWLLPIAHNISILSAFFSIVSATFLCFVGTKAYKDERKSPDDFTVPARWVPFPTTVAFRLFEVLKIFNQHIIGVEEDVYDIYHIVEVLQGCDVVVVRSSVEFEPECLCLLEDLNRKPILPMGQLPTTAYDNKDDDTNTWRWMKAWLDMQSKGFVVYVAFRIEAKPNQTELTEIAFGLEQSELSFFWVLRTRNGPYDTEVIELPERFKERTKERGAVCTSLAPQL